MSMKEQDILDAFILDKQKQKLLEYKKLDFAAADLVEGEILDSVRDLYFNGTTVYSIAEQTELGEELILYHIVDRGWDQKKHHMMEAIEDKIIEKIVDTKLKGVEAMTGILNLASQKYIDGIDNYLRTKDECHLIEIGIKTLKDYKTAVDVLKAFMDSGKNKGGVYINLKNAKSTIDARGKVITIENEEEAEIFEEPSVIEEKNTSSISDIAEEKRKRQRDKASVNR